MNGEEQTINLILDAILLATVSFCGAAVNSVAGGGTLLTFPVLGAMLSDIPGGMVTANTTSTIGLWPGALTAAWAYRDERRATPEWSRWLLVPSITGALLGSVALIGLPSSSFNRLVPWLVLLAAILFALQPWISSLSVRSSTSSCENNDLLNRDSLSQRSLAWMACSQFLIAVYGGYFGAGIGILMLASLGMARLGDIHRLNSVKNELATAVNGTAAGLFVLGSFAGLSNVHWPSVGVMACGSLAGGLVGSVLARRIPAALVRHGVAAIGFLLAAYYFGREWQLFG